MMLVNTYPIHGIAIWMVGLNNWEIGMARGRQATPGLSEGSAATSAAIHF